ncbi:MAG: sigma-54 dependent transcriptional regulator [Polyangiaceae bacterium]|nr:sigma-54 dependent transcriptional regulator [Polyangiaceae bacterium]
MKRVLLVEDEVVIRTELRRLLARHGFDVAEAGSVREALEGPALSTYDLILADVRLPGAPGTDLIEHARGVPVLMMTSYATVRGAVDAVKRGAVDYIAKPFDFDELLAAAERLTGRPPTEAGPRPAAAAGAEGELIGQSPPIVALRERVRKIAPTDATVLILGESGTGKELVARALHAQSRRRARPLVALNCAAIAEGLVESELFGHEKGAFTGATASYPGLLKAADGGTLFLDEIGELPPGAQARLLRVLQAGEVRPVGSTRTVRVDVRLLAATHRDLGAMVKAGAFRGDLYFRLRVLEIKLPPLRDRGGDVLTLARALLERAARRLGRAGLRLRAEAEAALVTHPWPGNVRELENAIERAAVLAEGDAISAEQLGLEGEGGEAKGEDATGVAAPPAEASLSLDEYFRRFVLDHQDVLTETELARRLGMSRKALWERRQRMALPRPR